MACGIVGKNKLQKFFFYIVILKNNVKFNILTIFKIIIY